MKASSLFFTPPKSTSKEGKSTLAFSFWLVLGLLVCGTLSAKWAWVFIAPKEVALPTTANWKKSTDAEHLFGDVATTDSAPAGNFGNVQLIGVFAHPNKGFAVLSVEGKQTGVGLGEWVMPNARLVEVGANHVLIERAGIKSRIDLLAEKPIAGIVRVGDNPNMVRPATSAPTVLDQLSPQQRAAMQQELQHFKGNN